MNELKIRTKKRDRKNARSDEARKKSLMIASQEQRSKTQTTTVCLCVKYTYKVSI